MVKRTPDNWQQLAIEGLHFEEYEVTAIALNNQPANACRVMLGKWRDGTGRGPKTWATLLQALRDIGMGELARELEGETQYSFMAQGDNMCCVTSCGRMKKQQ